MICGGKQEDGGGEDDGHDARIVHLERQEGALAAHHLVAHHALGVLDGDLSLALDDHDDADRDADEQDEHQDGERQAEGGLGPDRPEEQVVERLDRPGDLGQDADRDQERNAIADPALGDLLAQPHEQHRARGHEDDAGEEELGLADHDDRPVGIDVEARDQAARMALQGENQEAALDQADQERRVAGVLGQLLAADVAFLLEAAERRAPRRPSAGR